MFYKETTAMFIGHRDCQGIDREQVTREIERLVQKGVTTFLSGGMGTFDRLCEYTVEQLKLKYPHIRLFVIMPYPTFHPAHVEDTSCLVLPEGFEQYHPKAAIGKRNRYMVDHASYAICFVRYSWGGAAKTLQYAKRKNLLCVSINEK